MLNIFLELVYYVLSILIEFYENVAGIVMRNNKSKLQNSLIATAQ